MRKKSLLAFAFALASAACTSPEKASPPRTSTPATPVASPAQPSVAALASAPKMASAESTADAEPSPPPRAAPYDLEADRVARAARARVELGPRTTTTVVSDVFVVIGPPGWQGAAFDQSVALMRNAMAGYMNNRFGKKPSEAISVYLFANAAGYEAFCKKQYDAPCIAHYGFYSPSDRYMVMNAGLGLGTLTHELVHPLVEADFPGAPTWLNEGIASVFEAPVITKPGEIHGIKNWRHPRLKKAMTSREERSAARLDALFGMPDATFRGDREDLHYALARYVCQWLDERGKLWPFYQRWRDNAASDPTGTKAFADVTGMTPAAANDLWSKWALSL